ncbi:hypothetical protein [Paenibacillus dakarensis]|uniref:hypothetical protein n=1 Tax=Paenibacillus dakarensis TaxID=1527293 RepID=UPI0006D54CB2|nr:hypothetical protein [Paenibacillus dakarensis]
MNNTRLILVEGIPGSGKTSTAQYIKQIFETIGIPSRLYLEGDLNHPADYESVACLNEEEYINMKKRFPDHIETVEKFASPISSVPDHQLIYYGKLQQEILYEKASELINELRKYDLYNLSLEIYEKLILDKWSDFTRQVEHTQETIILECCFIQNPVTLMFGRFNQPEDKITAFIKKIEQMTQLLNPELIYFYQDDVKESLSRVIEERSEEWLQHVIWYFTQQGYGKDMGYQGFDGLCKVMDARKRYELRIMDHLNLDKLIINNSEYDWNIALVKVRGFLQV